MTANRCRRRAPAARRLALAGLCAAVSGLGATSSALGVPVLEVVEVTAQRLAAPARSASVAVSRRLPAAASETAPVLPSDLFRGMPGTFVQQTTPGQGIPIVRGLKGSQVLHLVDGFRLNNAFYRSSPNQYLGLVPTAGIASVEVARGAVATLYGSDAMGGAVQVVTRPPAFDRAFTAFGRAAWVSSDNGRQGTGGVAWGDDDNAVELAAQWVSIDDRETGGGETVVPSGYESRGVNLMTRHRLANGGEWRLLAQHLEQPSTPRVDELVPGYGQVEPSSSLFEFSPNERSFLGLVLEPAVDRPWADQARLQVGWQRIVDDRKTRDFGSPLLFTEQNRSDLYSASLVLAKRWSGAHRTRYGMDLTHDAVHSARQVTAGDAEPAVVGARFPDGSTLSSAALFLTHAWSPAPGTSIEFGGRYSRYRVELAATAVDPGARLEPDDLSLQFGVRREVGRGFTLLANVAEGFRVPNIFDLGTLGPRPGNRFNVANTDLGPETVLSADIGLRWEGEAARAELVFFRLDYEDRITSVETGELTSTGRIVVTSENIGRSRLHGAELGLRAQLSPRLALDATANWTRGEDRPGDGTTVPGDRIPPFNGRLALAWDPAGPWRGRAVLQFAAEQDRLSPRDVRDPRIDPNGTDGWAAWHLRAERDLGERWTVTVGVDNVLDTRYREHGSGLDAPGRGLALAVEAALP